MSPTRGPVGETWIEAILGGGFWTTMTRSARPVARESSVTRYRIVYVPGFWYVWVALLANTVVPSPRSRKWLVMEPSVSAPRPVRRTGWPSWTSVVLASRTADGRALRTLMMALALPGVALESRTLTLARY